MCEEAGCDAGATHDAAPDAEEGANDDADVDASDAGEENPGADTGTAPGSDGGEHADAGGAQGDASTGGEIDAAMTDAGSETSDSSVPLDAGGSTDSGATTDSGSGGTDSGSNTDAGGSGFVPVRFSATDHGASAFLSPDRLSVENRGEDRGNARSDAFITPGSGVFYFEAQRLIDTAGFYGIGIGTASSSLTGEMGAAADSLGLLVHGDFVEMGATCDLSPGFAAADQKHYYGFVIDYRSTSPRILYVLDDGNGGVEIRHRCTTTITTPVYIFYSAARWEVGYQIGINTGSDTVNLPFHFTEGQIKSALTAVSEGPAAAALVLGFGKTRALPLSADPVLSAPADRSVAAGSSVTLMGTATDAEDGTLTGSIQWVDISSQHHAQVTGSGGSFTFTAALGRHPVIVSVSDSVGRTVTHTVMVTATGTLPQPSQVRLIPHNDDPSMGDPLAGTDTLVSGDGLSIDAQASEKKGVRANQGIYGQYWYFEAHRNGAAANEGVGLVIPDGSLNPYDFVNPPWSMSINLTGSAWYNLNSTLGGSWDPVNNHYGFAVDYRGQHPQVHIIIGGALLQTIDMKDVWGPIYPMAYGNPTYSPMSSDPGYDITLNFGATPFVFNPATILGSVAQGLELGWGDINTP
jgi:hypothetical protein